MMRKRILISILTVVVSLNLFAVEVHSVRRNPPPPPPHHHHHPRHHPEPKDETSSFFADLFVSLWFLNNVFVTFDDYPYADGFYLNFFTQNTLNPNIFENENSTQDDNSGAIEDSDIIIPIRKKEQFYRFNLESGLFCFPSQKRIGNETRFEGYIWKFFGPVFENDIYSEKIFSNSQNDFIGNVRLGGQLSLLHSNLFDVSFFVQWSYFYGIYTNLNLNGVNCGFIIRSYPMKPILFEMRFNFQDFFDNLAENYFECHIEIGVELNSPYEVYVAWKLIEDFIFTDDIFFGFAFGMKYNF